MTAVGDEVLSPYWRRADPTVPVQVRQLNAFHTQGNNATLRWYPKGTTTVRALFTMEGQEAQSLLPHKNNQPTQFAAGSFAPTGAFGFKLDNEWSDDTKNNQTVDQSNGCPGPCGHHVRFWPLVDGSGNIVPNTWLMSMDYAGVNYDYNDNTFLISNIRPDQGTMDLFLPGPRAGRSGTHPELRRHASEHARRQGRPADRVHKHAAEPERHDHDVELLPIGSAQSERDSSGHARRDDHRGKQRRHRQYTGERSAAGRAIPRSTIRPSARGLSVRSTRSTQGRVKAASCSARTRTTTWKLAVTNKSGVPKLELFSEVGGTGTSVSTVTLPNPATLQTLDLYLIPDPATRHVRAAYRAVGPGGDTGDRRAAHRCGHPDRAAGPILRAQRRGGNHHEPQGVDPVHRDVRLLLRDAGRCDGGSGPAPGAQPPRRRGLRAVHRHEREAVAAGQRSCSLPRMPSTKAPTCNRRKIANTNDDVIYPDVPRQRRQRAVWRSGS